MNKEIFDKNVENLNFLKFVVVKVDLKLVKSIVLVVVYYMGRLVFVD